MFHRNYLLGLIWMRAKLYAGSEILQSKKVALGGWINSIGHFIFISLHFNKLKYLGKLYELVIYNARPAFRNRIALIPSARKLPLSLQSGNVDASAFKQGIGATWVDKVECFGNAPVLPPHIVHGVLCWRIFRLSGQQALFEYICRNRLTE